jgi:hypothetical protein
MRQACSRPILGRAFALRLRTAHDLDARDSVRSDQRIFIDAAEHDVLIPALRLPKCSSKLVGLRPPRQFEIPFPVSVNTCGPLRRTPSPPSDVNCVVLTARKRGDPDVTGNQCGRRKMQGTGGLEVWRMGHPV